MQRGSRYCGSGRFRSIIVGEGQVEVPEPVKAGQGKAT